MLGDPAATGETRLALASALHGGPLTPFERRLVQVLQDDLFRRVDDLSAPEACELSYRRMRYLREHLDLRIDTLLQNPADLLALHYWVSPVDGTLTTLLSIHFNLCLGSIVALSPDTTALAPLLTELDSMQSIGVFLATELGYGNNVQSLQTRAVYDHATREFVLHTPSAEAQKFMPNTGADGIAKIAVVMARLIVDGRNQGVFPFLVRIRDEQRLMPGVRVTRLGNKPDYPLDNAITSFERVRVPLHHWLSGPESRITEEGRFESEIPSLGKRFLTAMDRVQMGKLCLSAAAMGVLHSSLRLTLDYAGQRKTFAPGRRATTILSYRRYQQDLLEGVAAGFACSAMLHGVARRCGLREVHGVRVNSRLMALVKAMCSYEALDHIAMCRERLGAQGMFSANRVITYWLHVNGIVTAEGDNEVLLLRAARELVVGVDYAPPAQVGPPPFELIESPDCLLHLVRAHEAQLHRRLVESAREADASGSIFESWNESTCDGVLLARTHAERLALEYLSDQLDVCDDPEAREVLELLLRLYALRVLAGKAAALMIAGILSTGLAAQIEPERRRIAKALASKIDRVQSAFSALDELLDAPIRGDYIAAYDCRARPAEGDSLAPVSSFFRSLAPADEEGGRGDETGVRRLGRIS